MARDKPARASSSIELGEYFSAPTSTSDERIAFMGQLKVAPFTVPHAVSKDALNNLDVFWAVVSLDAVDVMGNLTLAQAAAELLLSDEPVLIRVSTYIGEMMIFADSNQHVAVRRDGATTFPSWILRTDLTAMFRHWPSL